MKSLSASVTGALLLIVAGSFIVLNHRDATLSTTRVWSTGVTQTEPWSERQEQSQTEARATEGLNVGTIALKNVEPSSPLVEKSTPRPENNPLAQTHNTAFESITSYLPQGLLSLEAPTEKKRTPLQQKLYEYGNTVGRIIDAYQTEYRTRQVSIMKDFYADRQNSEKQAPVQNMARAMNEVGTSLAGVDSVPSMTISVHNALAHDYQTLGKNLTALSQSGDNQSLLKNIDTYNAGAETFIKNYVALVSIFSAAGVSFSNGEPGRVFMFSGATL